MSAIEDIVDRALQYIALHWAVYPDILLELRNGKLTSACLSQPQHVAYRVMWEACCRAHDATHKIPTAQQLMFFVDEVVKNDMMIFDKPGITNAVKSIIDVSFEMQLKEQLNKDFIYSQNMIPIVLNELVVNPTIRTMANSADLTNAQERADMLSSITGLIAAASSIGGRSTDVFDIAKLGGYMQGSELEITGVRFYDELFGGIPRGSFNGALGLTGHGKTTFGIHLGIERGLMASNTDFYTYEQPVQGNFTRRLVAATAGCPVPHDCDNPRDLPEEAFKLLMSRAPVLREHLNLVDMSGAIPGQGSGGVIELCDRIVASSAREYSRRPRLAIVDWFGTMIDKSDDNSLKSKQERMKIALTKMNEVAAETGISIMLLHQIKPEAKLRYSPDKIIPDQEAEECKAFSQLMYNCLTFGVRDDATQAMLAAPSKARSGAMKHYSIVRLRGALSRIEDASHELAFNDDRGPREPYFRSKKSGKLPAEYADQENMATPDFSGL